MIMVMLGGLTMWIDPKSVPARVSMGKHLNKDALWNSFERPPWAIGLLPTNFLCGHFSHFPVVFVFS